MGRPPKLTVVSGGQGNSGAPITLPLIDLPKVDGSPRAIALRRIADIAALRGWQLEIVRALDRFGVNFVEALSDEAVFSLRERMEYLEDCVQCGCDPDDAPPAR